MVYTSQIVVFTRVGSEELTDIIPLNEILMVKELDADQFNSFIETKEDEEEADDACVLQIDTLPNGYNSGRVYKILLTSKKFARTIIADLKRLSDRERERSEAKSRFKKIQDNVAGIINSRLVQQFLAFLIITVRVCRREVL